MIKRALPYGILESHTLRNLTCLISFVILFCIPCAAQNTRTNVPINPVSADKSSPTDESQAANAMAEEMRVKRAIKYAEKEHRQSLDRAREASDLGQAIAASFKRKQSLDREDIKKLDRLEKLAKRIRSDAGGSDDEITLEKIPCDLADAINRIAEVASSLNDRVQETPRQVVSTTVIDKVNVLLELIGVVRNFSNKAST